MKMFFPGSRYLKLSTYQVAKPDGTTVKAIRLPLPANPPLLGFHPRQTGQRLDLIASHFLNDATAFWQLCGANNSMVPDALAVHNLVAIPGKARF
jgi:hypothetical protein